jgi:hypothetical protein
MIEQGVDRFLRPIHQAHDARRQPRLLELRENLLHRQRHAL